MSGKKPILYSALLLTAVNLTLRLVSTAFQVYLSGKIGASGIGLIQLVLSVGGMALTAGMAGIRTATMYLTATELGKNRKQNIIHVLSASALYSILCSGMVSSVLYIIAPFIAHHWIGIPNALNAIRLLCFFLPVNCLCGVMIGYFTAANRIGTLAAVEVSEQVVSMAVTMTILTFWVKGDAVKACETVILGSGFGSCMTLILLTALRVGEKAPTGKKIPLRKNLLNIAVPLALADDLKAGINTAENIMVPKRLAHYAGNPLALFGTVCGMVFPVLMFPAAIVFSLAELLIPEMARCAAAGSQIRITYLARKSLQVVLIYGLLFGGLLFLLAKPLCMQLYQNSDAGTYLALYAPLAPMLYCDAIIDAMNKGLGKQKICVMLNIVTAILDVGLLFILLPKYGMVGYFTSFLTTHLLNFICSLMLLIKTANIPISFQTPVLSILAAGIAVFLCSLVRNTILRSIGYILAFFSILTLFGILSRREIRWIKGLIQLS